MATRVERTLTVQQRQPECVWPGCYAAASEQFADRPTGYQWFCDRHGAAVTESEYPLLLAWSVALARAANDDEDCATEIEALIQYAIAHCPEAVGQPQ